MSRVPRCVQCALELTPAGFDGVLGCSACGGEFCEKEALETALKRAKLGGSARPYARPVMSLTEPLRYVACPVCKQQMIRRNFGAASGVVVDVCAHHGVWFDRGELAQVLAFCASGALAQAEATRARPGLAPPPPRTQSGLDAVDVLEACAELITTFIFD